MSWFGRSTGGGGATTSAATPPSSTSSTSTTTPAGTSTSSISTARSHPQPPLARAPPAAQSTSLPGSWTAASSSSSSPSPLANGNPPTSKTHNNNNNNNTTTLLNGRRLSSTSSSSSSTASTAAAGLSPKAHMGSPTSLKNAQMHPPVLEDVPPDWTDWSRLRTLLWVAFLRLADSAAYVVVNGVILAAAVWVGVVGYLFVGPLMQVLAPWLSRPIQIRDPNPNTGSTLTQPVRLFLRSSVSASTPNFHDAYTDYITKRGALHQIGALLNKKKAEKTRPPFNPEIAKFFIQLSALVYENREVVAGQWGLKVETIELDSCAAFIFYSIQHGFVVVAMRGVSPFDLTEFLMNAMLQKVNPEEGVLPGQIHEAFYNLLSFSSNDNDSIVEIAGNESTNHGLDTSELSRIIQEVVIPQLQSSTPSIWFTGHSVGGALATLAVSHLIFVKSPLVTSSFIKGCYTFGSPKCGDSDFATEMANHCNAAQVVFYRLINADDIVTAMPVAGHSSGGLVNALRNAQPQSKRMKSYTDYKHLGIPVVLHYDGTCRVGADRDLDALIKNAVLWVGELPLFIKRILLGRTNLVSIGHHTFPFPFDHLPSEYEHTNTHQQQPPSGPENITTQADLLHWAVLHTATASEDAPRRTPEEIAELERKAKQLDPKWVDVILGKSDAVRMKEAMEVITDASKSVDDRLAAFDELELLVESLDNANDLRTLNLWKPIIGILASDPEPELRAFAAWVIGTAVQNNPRSQKDFYETDASIATLATTLATETDLDVLAKSVTLLSSLVRHNPLAKHILDSLSSFSSTSSSPFVRLLTLRAGPSSRPAIAKIQKRVVFLLANLIGKGEAPADARAALLDAAAAAGDGGWMPCVVAAVEDEVRGGGSGGGAKDAADADAGSDPDLLEKCLALVSVVATARPAALSPELRGRLANLVPAVQAKYLAPPAADDDDGPTLDAAVWEEFKRAATLG
ncbi:hypothetical protein DFJ73DRAFT_941739 [Zopfochytrium polystomum]|nr:hypothetical protein DFJ73DRAFT_941739 [Zopfochytrium polystomum]